MMCARMSEWKKMDENIIYYEFIQVYSIFVVVKIASNMANFCKNDKGEDDLDDIESTI